MYKFGKYEIYEEIGSGTFGTVYHAKDTLLELDIALKILKQPWMNNRKAVEMFYKEGRIAARLEHPNIVTVREIGDVDGKIYIAMSLVNGKSLKSLIESNGPMPLQEILPIAQQISSALTYGHAQRIVHRDIKPTNILIRSDGTALLTDFGLVQGTEQAGTAGNSSLGSLVGTPEYIAPEIWESGIASPVSDSYAFTCVIYEMLTGKALFSGSNTPMIMRKHFAPRDLTDVNNRQLLSVLEAGLEINPAKRVLAHQVVTLLSDIKQKSTVIDTQPSLSSKIKRYSFKHQISKTKLWLLAALALGSIAVLLFVIIALGALSNSSNNKNHQTTSPSRLSTALKFGETATSSSSVVANSPIPPNAPPTNIQVIPTESYNSPTSVASATIVPEFTPKASPLVSPTLNIVFPTSTNITYKAPSLIEPPNSASFTGPMKVIFQWSDSTTLGPYDFYVLSIEHSAGVDEQWVKTTSAQAPIYMQSLKPFRWSVSIRRRNGQAMPNGAPAGILLAPPKEYRLIKWEPDPPTSIPNRTCGSVGC